MTRPGRRRKGGGWTSCALAFSVMIAAGLARPSFADLLRDGLWVSAGGGWAEAKVDCRECDDAHFESAAGARFAVGGTPSAHVRLGLELFGMKRGDGSSETEQLLALVGARWSPSSSSGFHFRAGYGLAHGRQGFSVGDSRILETNTGIAWLIGTGWELPLGRFYLTPSASMLVAAYGTVETDAGVLEDALTTTYWIGVDLTLP